MTSLLAPPDVFDVCGPLPTGTTVLEASAGTGKTFTIAALATRYVAEGHADLADLLLVTFGRAATSELRDRVRERLVSAERALRAVDARTADDPLIRLLADVDDDELDRRRSRLTRALADVDAATITTTHGFCHQMLLSLGVAGDMDRDAVLLPDIADLVDEVVDDLYLQRYADDPDPVLSVSEARAVARAAAGDRQARLEPADADPATQAGHRYALARDVVAEVAHRKRARRLLDYDDQLTLLRDALVHPEHGPVVAERIRSRYRVVMVDEFQDTDPVQWTVLERAFHGHRTLVLIGDPKQAVYAFRGGDVHAYLAARTRAHHVATLGRSWRSDAPLARALDAVLGGAALGDDAIVVHPVQAQHAGRRLDGGAPLRVRQVTRAAFGPRSPSAGPRVQSARDLVVADVAADVVRQLGGVRVQDGDGWRPLRPADVAVLTRTNKEAAQVRDELVACGVPAVVSGQASVFDTPAARAWSTLLAALEQPGRSGLVAAAALTPFLGWDAARLATAGDDERDALADTLRRWSRLLATRGVAALLEAAAADGLAERLLRTDTGERVLTDLRHIGQVLHAAALEHGLGTSALTEWLRRRTQEADADYAEERSRRLETDAAAVQVVTVHSAKGLEFPVVYVPFGWDRNDGRLPGVLRYHDERGERVLSVGGSTDPGHDEAGARHRAEERGEDLRLLYVALTRARSQVVLWWCPTQRNTACGPLTRLLLGGHPPGAQPPERVTAARLADDAVATRLAGLAAGSQGTVVHELVDAAPARLHWPAAEPTGAELSVGRLGRVLDQTWRRTSYTGLTAAAHATAPGVTSEPETTGVQDETDIAVRGGAATATGTGEATGEVAGEPAGDDPLAQPSPMADLPGGAAFGTVVHEVLEHVDPEAGDPAAELARRCAESGSARTVGVAPEVLAAALEPVLATPLGPTLDGLTLADVPARDRLAELEFELPLGGGDAGLPIGGGDAATAGRVAGALADVADLLRRELPADDLFAAYPDRMLDDGLGSARLLGYLTGSIDVVLRVGPPENRRYVVVDYKTNHLAAPDEPLTLGHYRPAAMAEAMMRSHYPLQLLLYTVALHRYLRWRVPGYHPDRHLGGGLYLFVRGMAGPATPVVDGSPCGVLAWRPPTTVVTGLSTLLDGTR